MTRLHATTMLCAAWLLAGCEGGLRMPEMPDLSLPDIDLRSRDDGFSTAAAAQAVDSRPAPDDRGVISYPNYQVVVARRGDTVGSIAGRLGVDAATLATYNGVDVSAPLRRDEIVALPGRVTEPSPATGAPRTGPVQPQAPVAVPVAAPVAVSEIATAALDRVDATPPAQPAATPTAVVTQGTEPLRHQVLRGETAYQIARQYGVPVTAIAQWNGLGPELRVREGQFLLIPQGGSGAPPAPVLETATEPGTGSVAPEPPSAATPLPEASPATQPVAAATAAAPAEPPVPSPNLGADQAPAPEGRLARPVSGSIIRDYAAGRNDGIDFGAAAGTEVRAAAAGTVAAVTTDTSGVQIMVIRHEGGLLTVYTHIEALRVERGSTVSRGQVIGQVRAGDPSFLHFEVREGMESRDPSDYLGG